MDTSKTFEKPSYEREETCSVAIPTGLFSVVDAFCQGVTTSTDDDNDESNDADDKSNDMIQDVIDSSSSSEVQSNKNLNANEQANIIDVDSTRSFTESSLTSNSPSIQNKPQKERQGLEGCVVKNETPTSQIQLPDINQSFLKLETNSVLPNKSIDVPTYTINNTRIVLVPDLYSVVREACGTCSPLRGIVNRLSIVPRRFDPFQMLRLKHVGAVNLEVKCCSYILLQEFFQVVSRYKNKTITPDMLNVLPAIDISTSTEPVEKAAIQPRLSHHKVLPSHCDAIHTFIVKEEVVVCAVELQQVFESVFGSVLSMSLAKLGIRQSKFTPLQLDEVMDFVDVDESNMAAAGFYMTKKDAERVFQYTEALFNVDQLKIKWLDPLRLSDSEPSPLHEHHAQEKVENLRVTASQSLSTAPSSDTIEASKSELEPKSFFGNGGYHLGNEEDELDNVNEQEIKLVRNEVCGNVSSTSDNVPGISSLVSDEMTSHQGTSKNEIHEMKPTEQLQQEKNQILESDQRKQDHEHSYYSGGEPVEYFDGGEPQQTCSDDLTPSEDQDTADLSPAGSDGSMFSDSDSCSSICTYMIDGDEVVCIPDIHKIVIHLYGQSVQVGYYLQRLQIPTQRFSTVHVKRLKALHALNSKATLCTYILKSDALRLFKMYDVFCTDSKLQHIQWNGPVSLEALHTSQFPTDDSLALSQENLMASQEPIEVVKIPTFLIDGEIVVSVPDAHKVVQVLNGQSVQVRYNMDKLGIVKRRYSYSQVYQLRAISDLKRPSMCTFITKNDADKLLDHYLTAENASRLKYIHWMPPVQLEERKSSGAIGSQDGALLLDVKNIEEEKKQQTETSCLFGSSQSKVMKTGEEVSFSSFSGPSLSCDERRHSYEDRVKEFSGTVTSAQPHCTVTMVSSSNENPCVVTMAEYSGVPCEPSTSTVSSRIPCSVAMETSNDRGNTQESFERCEIGKKRAYDTIKNKFSVLVELQQIKDEKNDIAATLERKETEMRILHDAYQQQVAHERKKRLEAEKETEELKASNAEVCKNLQRKESEMKILHDSYQYQMRKEREKRQELENDLIDLRGSVAFASGVAIHDPKIKQENPL